MFSKQHVFILKSEVSTSSHQSWSTDSRCSQKCQVLSSIDMHTSPLGYFTCFLVRVFPVLSLMYLAINSFLPETKKNSWWGTSSSITPCKHPIWAQEPHLSLQQLGSIPHCPPGLLSHLLGRHCVCNGMEPIFFLCLPTCRDLQAERHLLGQQHDLSCWGSCKGWAPLLFAPGVVVLSANHPDVPAPLHAPILQGGQQDLSLLPGILLQRWKSLSQCSSLSITPLTPLTRVPALQCWCSCGINTSVCYSELCFSWKCEMLPSL